MSAATLSVGRLRARYRVAPRGDERRALDGVLALMLDDALEPALARATAEQPAKHVCIRRVDAPVRLALARQPATALADAWAAAIAAAIAERVRFGGPDVVRYGSLRHALLDFALCVAAGEHERDWAWRSLGLWPAGAAEPARALVLALADDGRAVAPVLAAVARARALGGLVERLAPSAWLELAAAALGGAGAPADVARRALAASASPVATVDAVGRAVERSDIATALAATGAPVVAIAALALVEVEPGAVGALGERLVGALALARGDPASAPAGEPSSPEPSRAATPEPQRAGSADAVARTLSQSAAKEEAERELAITALPQSEPAPPAASEPGREAPQAPLTEEERSSQSAAASADGLAVAPRARGASTFGGLVFAVHAVAALGLASRFAQLPDVALRSALHALALALAPERALADAAPTAVAGLASGSRPDGVAAPAAARLAPGDPAALGFAGLAPGSEPPAALPDGAHAVIDAAVADVRDWLAAHLECEPSQLDLPALLRRRARIVADPGWIEFHLDVDEIDTAVRRAGLDLDPDYLPFLGCVLRIVYA